MAVQDSLEQLTAPTLIAWCTDDVYFDVKWSHCLGHSRGLRRLKGRKLFWPEELPEVVAAEARQLWS